MLWNIGMSRTRLNCRFLLTSDGSGSLQIVGHVRDTPMAGHAEGRASVVRFGWIIPGISHTIMSE